MDGCLSGSKFFCGIFQCLVNDVVIFATYMLCLSIGRVGVGGCVCPFFFFFFFFN